MIDTDGEKQGHGGQDENSPCNRRKSWRRRTRHRNDTNKLQQTKEGQDCPNGADLLFGLGSGETLKSWPGIEVFCRHLGAHFKALLQPRFDVIWRIIGKEPLSSADGWHWCAAVLDAFGTGGDDDTSMVKAFQELVRNGKVAGGEIGPQERNQVLLAMFAVLCWMSVALKPIVIDPSEGGTATNANNPFCLAAEASTRTYFSKDFRRPVSKMFCAYRDQTLVADGWASRDAVEQGGSRNNDASPSPSVATDDGAGAGSDDALYVPSLEYSALFTIGRVRLEWVDTLSAHLAFDRSKRTLSVFRYPSFCVANILRTKDVNVIKKITSKLLPSYNDDGTLRDSSEIYREVLLSYRILFGQSSKSRKLAFQNLNHSPGVIAPGDLDPFLLKICTSQLTSGWPWSRRPAFPSTLFPVSVLDFDENLQAPDTYSAQDDFPVFGRRLLKLQRYNLRQRPRKWKDLWLDRRTPLQWYTFWAVFWVGGLSILLATLQLFVGVSQLYYAIRQPGSSGS